MGDRGNIKIEVEGYPPLWIYTHWEGSVLPETVRRGLIRGRPRWDDPAYLTRILFDEVTGDDRGLTGFGVSTFRGDGGETVIVNLTAMEVTVEGQAWSFEDYSSGGAREENEPEKCRWRR
jgi:hypothetical protein